jgi:hypothetical protein
MVGKDIYTNYGTVGQTEWPDGEARDTQWASKADGHPDGAQRRVDKRPTETGSGPTEGSMCARRRAGSRGVAQRRVSAVVQQGTI